MTDTTEPSGASTVREQIVLTRRDRPWLGPAIASAIAFLVLLFLLIPGILLYPEASEANAVSDADLEAQRAHNDALEARILALQGVLETGVCIADGQYQVPPVYGPNGEILGSEEERQRQQSSLDEVLPPPPSRQPVPVPEGSDAEGASAEPGSAGPADTHSLLNQIDAATVLVVSQTGHGTGFFIDPTHILTNRHVANGEVGSQVYVASGALGQVREAVIKASTPANTDMGEPDFALLELVSGSGSTQLPLAATPERLVPVVAGGFPGLVVSSDSRFQRLMEGDLSAMPSPSVTEGVVTTVQQSRTAEVLLHTAQITPGNSGGPLVDRCGRLVGMNTFVRGEETTGGRINAALTTEPILAFLAEAGLSAPPVASGACGSAQPEPAPAPAPDVEAEPEDETPGEE